MIKAYNHIRKHAVEIAKSIVFK